MIPFSRTGDVCLVACCAFIVSNVLGADRVEVPPKDQQDAAQKSIAEVYRDEYQAAKKPLQRIALAKKLIQVATDTHGDDASQYALWRIAKDVAVAGGDFDVAENAIDKLAERFKIDVFALKTQSLESTAIAPEAVPDFRKLAGSASRLLGQVVGTERFELADRLAEFNVSASKRTGDTKLIAESEVQRKQLEKTKSAYRDVPAALESIAKDASNGPANLIVGQFRCFVKDDWASGLPLLAVSNNLLWNNVAKKDLANPADEAGQVSVADE